jgi:hypothetical protein
MRGRLRAVSGKSRRTSTFLRHDLHPPLEGEGRLTLSAAKCETGWGGETTERDLASHHSLLHHPTPPLRVDPPPPGEGENVGTPSPSRNIVCPSFAIHSPSKRGRREDRVRAAPAVSCAKIDKKTHTSIQVQRKQSGLPCAMVLRLIFVLSPARPELVCHRHPQEA